MKDNSALSVFNSKEYSVHQMRVQDDHMRKLDMEKPKKKFTISMMFNSQLAMDGLEIKFNNLSKTEKLVKIRTVIDEYMGNSKWMKTNSRKR